MNALTEIKNDAAACDIIFPYLGSGTAADMARIAVVCDVIRICQEINAWGVGATRDKSLRGAIQCAADWRCVSMDRQIAVIEFIGAFMPGGVERQMDHMPREEREKIFCPCISKAKEIEKSIRHRMKARRGA